MAKTVSIKCCKVALQNTSPPDQQGESAVGIFTDLNMLLFYTKFNIISLFLQLSAGHPVKSWRPVFTEGFDDRLPLVVWNISDHRASFHLFHFASISADCRTFCLFSVAFVFCVCIIHVLLQFSLLSATVENLLSINVWEEDPPDNFLKLPTEVQTWGVGSVPSFWTKLCFRNITKMPYFCPAADIFWNILIIFCRHFIHFKFSTM